MGKTAEALAKEHGSVDLVVLHNAVSYRDPEDAKEDPAEYAYRTAFRGDTITVDKQAAKRLVDLGSAANPKSQEASYALAGMRSPGALATPPSATAQLTPESEQARAMQTAIDRIGDPETLMKLDLDQLKTVAVAFGVEVKKNDSKESLAKRIAGDGGAAAEEEAAEARAHRDSLGGPVEPVATSEGVETVTDSSGQVNATEGAIKVASENGVDLGQVSGSGADGRITQPDVVKFIADRDAG